jgi:hypothetical protein
VLRYFQRAYWTSWYDVSRAGVLGGLRWEPDVKYLMNQDPLTHRSRFRWCAVGQGFRDLLILLFALSLWMTVRLGITFLAQVHTTEDQMRVPVFLFGFCTLAATLAGVFYQLRVKARSENRQHWINEIREILASLIADLPAPNDSDKVRAKKRQDYLLPHAKLELLLNPSERVHRTLMALLRHAYGFDDAPIDEIPRLKLGLRKLDPENRPQCGEFKSQITRLANVTLKREWEQVKHAR